MSTTNNSISAYIDSGNSGVVENVSGTAAAAAITGDAATSAILSAIGTNASSTLSAILGAKTSVTVAVGADSVTSYGYANTTDDVVLVIPGNNQAANVATGSGNDVIVAKNLQGTVSTGAGSDAIFVAQSATTYNLGTGNDSLFIGSATGSLTIDGGNDADFVSLTAGDASGSTFNLGTGNDSILIGATASDVTIVGGAGNDYISLGSGVTSAVIQVGTNTGIDTVLGFTAGFSDEADILATSSLSNVKSVTFDAATNNVTIKQGSSTVVLGAEAGSAADADYADVKVKVGSTTSNVSFVNGTKSVASDGLSDIYYAANTSDKTQKLDFSNYSDALVVDLTGTTASKYVSNKDAYTGFDTKYYGTFEEITGGTSTTMLVGGADTKETLTSGGGDTTLYGGGKANDLMVGGDGKDTFIYLTGNGKDTVQNFTAGTDENADVLALGWSNATEAYVDSNGDVVVKYNAATDKLTVSGVGADASIQYTLDNGTSGVAKVGTKGQANSFSYDSAVTAYMGQNSTDTLVVSGSDNLELWMDGGSGAFFNSIDVVDASSATGNVGLAGKDGSESLVGGSGQNSLWGGTAGNDTLQGGSGTTNFYFGKGNGSDVVITSSTDDMVMAYDISLSDVAGWTTNGNNDMVATLTDGSKLTVSSSSGVSNYQLSDGSQWTYDHNNKTWSQK